MRCALWVCALLWQKLNALKAENDHNVYSVFGRDIYLDSVNQANIPEEVHKDYVM